MTIIIIEFIITYVAFGTSGHFSYCFSFYLYIKTFGCAPHYIYALLVRAIFSILNTVRVSGAKRLAIARRRKIGINFTKMCVYFCFNVCAYNSEALL